MSLWKRLKTALGAPEDRQEQLRKEVERLEGNVTEAMAALEGLRGDIADLERRGEELREQEDRWERDASQCLRRGDEATARECLARAEAVKKQRDAATARLDSLRATLADRERLLADLRRQLEEYRAEASTLEHRGEFAGAAKGALESADRLGAEGTGLLEDVRQQVESDELETEVRSRLSSTAQTPEKRIADGAEQSAVDARLEALRKQLDRG